MSAPQPPSLDQLKETVRQEWTEGADAWRRWDDQWTVMSQPMTDAIVAAVGNSPGLSVLDLASGGGQVASSLVAALGPEGHVTVTDLIPDMLAIAEGKAQRLGIANLAFQVADIEALPFADGAFDVVTCRLGIMFAPDAGRALGEIRRVLKPRGQAIFLVWGPPGRNPFLGTPMACLSKRIQAPPPPPGTPGGFRFAQTGALATLLGDAEFEEVREEELHLTLPWPSSAEEYWEFAREIGPVIRRLLAQLSPGQRDEVGAEILREVERYVDGQQVRFPAVMLLVTGKR